MQYTENFFCCCKNENSQCTNFDIFLIFAQNIDCGYTLGPPRRGGSNEYLKSLFRSTKFHIMITFLILFKSVKISSASSFFMPPISEEVEGAYWFGSVRAVQWCVVLWCAVCDSVMRE